MQVVVSPSCESSTVTVIHPGPQGPQGPKGDFVVNDAAKIDKSIVYYDAATASFKADATWTTSTIVDGANF